MAKLGKGDVLIVVNDRYLAFAVGVFVRKVFWDHDPGIQITPKYVHNALALHPEKGGIIRLRHFNKCLTLSDRTSREWAESCIKFAREHRLANARNKTKQVLEIELAFFRSFEVLPEYGYLR